VTGALRRFWRWLIAPQLCLPPTPDDANMRGLGWAGDRRAIRLWLAKHMGDPIDRVPPKGK
jgi:hypothetical protein